jgi:hypothetical protein
MSLYFVPVVSSGEGGGGQEESSGRSQENQIIKEVSSCLPPLPYTPPPSRFLLSYSSRLSKRTEMRNQGEEKEEDGDAFSRFQAINEGQGEEERGE